MLFAVNVGFTTQRPIIPDQRSARVILDVEDDNPVQAQLDAALWLAHHPGVVMVTSTSIAWAEL